VRKGEEFKAPRYASAAATRDYITTRDIIPNNTKIQFTVWYIIKRTIYDTIIPQQVPRKRIYLPKLISIYLTCTVHQKVRRGLRFYINY
jgi:hypothetical protein